MKTKRIVKVFLSLMLLILMSVGTATLVSAAPNDRYYVNVTGSYQYSKVRTVLDLVNAERANVGVQPLGLDYTLTECAMQRAAEIAVHYSHTRANGSSCFTLNSKIHGENIAIGYNTSSTPQEVYSRWKNSAGHYANMIRSSFNSIGIGCFALDNGYYWVQVFSNRYASGWPETQDQIQTRSVELIEFIEGSNYPLILNTGEIEPGDTRQLWVTRTNSGFPYLTGRFNGSSFYWTSSNPSVIRVDSSGKITAVNGGTATITATPTRIVYGQPSVSVSIQSRISIEKVNVSGISTYTYSGKAYSPSPTLTYKGKTLRKGTDYTVTYKNNVNAGNAQLVITGKGMYYSSKTVTYKIQPRDVSKVAVISFGNNTSKSKDVFQRVCDFVTITVDGKKLTGGKNGDYYSSSVGTDGGHANQGVSSFNIYFLNNYTGSLGQFFEVPEMTMGSDQYEYTGKPIEPRMVITDLFFNYLGVKEGEHYTVSYTNNTNPGTAYVTVRGKGHYWGSRTYSFKIVKTQTQEQNTNNSQTTPTSNTTPISNTTVTTSTTTTTQATTSRVVRTSVPVYSAIQQPITIKKAPTSLKVKGKKNKAIVSWRNLKKTKKNKKILAKVKYIHLQCSDSPAFSGNVMDVRMKKSSKGLKITTNERTTLYIRLRYVGNGGVSRWTKTKRVTTK